MSWAGVFLPTVIPAVGGGDDVDVELPQAVRALQITAYNATATRGTIAAYFLIQGTTHLLDATTPAIILDPLVVKHPGIVPRAAKIRVTFANTVAVDSLHVNISYEVEN
jgi:hypothetical protein